MHLEEDEQVEQVAGQEGAVEAHQLELQQRVEVHARAVPARGANRSSAAKATTPVSATIMRRQPVGHQHDAEGRAPVARQVDADRAGPAAGVGRVDPAQQRERDDQARSAPESTLSAALARRRCSPSSSISAAVSSGTQDRRGDQVRHADSSRRSSRRAAASSRSLAAAPRRPRGRCRSGRARPAARPGTAPSSRSRSRWR